MVSYCSAARLPCEKYSVSRETGMADDALRASCQVCGSSISLKRCSRCKCVLYCSRKHQAEHWPAHKTACKQVTSRSKRDSVTQDKTCQDKGSRTLAVNTNSQTTVNRKIESATGEECLLIRSKERAANTTIHNADSERPSDISFVEFDTRPYKPISFDQPPSFDFEDLAKYMTSSLKSTGYCVTDGLFDIDLLTEVQREFAVVNETGQMRPGQLSGGTTSGEDELKVTKADIRNDKLAWIEGKESHIPATCKVVKTMDDIIGRFNEYLGGECYIQGRTKAMMACYPGNGSFYRRHVDNPNKDGRVITCILYLNSDWDVLRDGGLLRILPENSEDQVDIAPFLNRLLVFWSDRRNPHEVHPAHRTRYALTVWYFDGEERVKAKENRISEEMSKIRGEMSILEVKTKTAEKDNISQKIVNESMKAVAGLSEEELDALATMVKGHADPGSILSGMGIAVSIQQALLPVLRSRTT